MKVSIQKNRLSNTIHIKISESDQGGPLKELLSSAVLETLLAMIETARKADQFRFDMELN